MYVCLYVCMYVGRYFYGQEIPGKENGCCLFGLISILFIYLESRLDL